MPLFQPADIDPIVAQIARHAHLVARALGHDDAPTEASADSPLARDLLRLVGVANGAYDRTDANVRRAELAVERVTRVVRAGIDEAAGPFPDAFWQTTLGVLLARGRWWVSADDLLTISNAAALAFGENTQANRMRITRAIDRGVLDAVPDPSVANPQHNRRVLKSQVERLGARRRPAAPRGARA